MALKELPGPNKGTLVRKELISAIVSNLAIQIVRDYGDDDQAPVLIPVLEGAMEFTVDLGRQLYKLGLDCPRTSAFSDSYGNGKVSSGKPVIIVGPKFNSLLNGRRAIITEDTTETEKTIDAVKERALQAGATDVEVAALTSKNLKSSAKYIGITLSKDAWLEGNGLDSEELGRSNPDVIER